MTADRVQHVYVHVPFCSRRCGYCDFVTVTGRSEGHARYVGALLAELELEGALLERRVETVYLGGGTPTYLGGSSLARLLAGLPTAGEVTVEANPETVTPALAGLLGDAGVTRVSVGAQSFQPSLLGTLERQAGPDSVRVAVRRLRDAGVTNLSLDLLYGIPGQTSEDLVRDLDAALALEPEHLSCYELEAKPGTRFAHRHGAALCSQQEAMEGYMELVVDTLTHAGYRWYETANFCRPGCESRHNLGYWRGSDYLGLGIGAVSTLGARRWRNQPGLAGYLAAVERGDVPPRDLELLARSTRRTERLMLGLRLDEPVDLRGMDDLIDPRAADRLEHHGLLVREGGRLALTRRGQLLGDGVTSELLAETPGNDPVPAEVSALLVG